MVKFYLKVVRLKLYLSVILEKSDHSTLRRRDTQPRSQGPFSSFFLKKRKDPGNKVSVILPVVSNGLQQHPRSLERWLV